MKRELIKRLETVEAQLSPAQGASKRHVIFMYDGETAADAIQLYEQEHGLKIEERDETIRIVHFVGRKEAADAQALAGDIQAAEAKRSATPQEGPAPRIEDRPAEQPRGNRMLPRDGSLDILKH
jgi:hypothetical protein